MKKENKFYLRGVLFFAFCLVSSGLFAQSISESSEKTLKDGENLESADDESVPFTIIEEVPVYPGCESLTSNEEKRSCFNLSIQKFIGSEWNPNVDHLPPGKKRTMVMFKIDRRGYVVDVMASSPHKVLHDEAVRVISSLPKMQPGTQRGKTVGVRYSLPLVTYIEAEEEDEEY